MRCLLTQRNYQDVMKVLCNCLLLLTVSHEQLKLVCSSLHVGPVMLSVGGGFTARRYEEGVFWHRNPSGDD